MKREYKKYYVCKETPGAFWCRKECFDLRRAQETAKKGEVIVYLGASKQIVRGVE